MQKALIALDSLEGSPGPWTFGRHCLGADRGSSNQLRRRYFLGFKHRLEEPRAEYEPGHEVALRYVAMAWKVPETHPARRWRDR
jgi:hypothetical protein